MTNGGSAGAWLDARREPVVELDPRGDRTRGGTPAIVAALVLLLTAWVLAEGLALVLGAVHTVRRLFGRHR